MWIQCIWFLVVPGKPKASWRRPEYWDSYPKYLWTLWRIPEYCESSPPNIWGAWSEDLQRDSVLTDLISVPVPLPNARAFPPACHCSMAKATLALVFLIDPLTISRGLHVTVGISSWGGTSILLRKLRGNPTHWRILQQGESFESCHLGSGSVKWLSSEPREVSGQRVLRALSKMTGSSSEATTRVWWSNRKRGIWGPGVACWLHLPPDVLGDSIKPRAPP